MLLLPLQHLVAHLFQFLIKGVHLPRECKVREWAGAGPGKAEGTLSTGSVVWSVCAFYFQ